MRELPTLSTCMLDWLSGWLINWLTEMDPAMSLYLVPLCFFSDAVRVRVGGRSVCLPPPPAPSLLLLLLLLPALLWCAWCCRCRGCCCC